MTLKIVSLFYPCDEREKLKIIDVKNAEVKPSSIIQYQMMIDQQINCFMQKKGPKISDEGLSKVIMKSYNLMMTIKSTLNS